MIAFLRLFREYRELELAVLKLQAELNLTHSERDFYRHENTRLRDEHTADLRKMADALSFQANRRNVFARADAGIAMGVEAAQQELLAQNTQRRVMARELVLKKNAETADALRRSVVNPDTLASLEKLREEMSGEVTGLPNG